MAEKIGNERKTHNKKPETPQIISVHVRADYDKGDAMSNKVGENSDKSDRKEEPDTEERILEAAELEFMTKGFAGARTTSIAEAAGVTHAMLHYYFRTKEKLFDRIVSEKFSLLREMLIASVVDDDLPFNELIRNIIYSHLDFIAANPFLPRFLLGELSSCSEKSAIVLSKIKQNVPEIIAGMQEKIDLAAARGECRRVDAKMLMMDIASLNLFSFMTAPVINAIFDDWMNDSEKFLQQRKENNYDLIMRKLNP